MPDQYKIALRDTIRQVRSKISAQFRKISSNQICTRIRFLEEFRQAKKIALYIPVNGEVDLTPIWAYAHEHGKTCYFPVLRDDKTLIFLPATPETSFTNNRYDIPEPNVDESLALSPKEMDLMFMPLVAFDARCTRLGMGAGYYDRTLENKPTLPLFGVAYQFQRVDFIEPQPWDVPLDAVITQNAIYWRNFLT